VGGSKEITVGHRYYLGMHMVLCHGPVDSINTIYVDKRIAWLGTGLDETIIINKPGLFGGDDREGGVSGTVNLLGGGPAQAQNTYLQARLGTDIPAFRGVTSVVLNQCYLGLNPYLKPWAFKASRIHSTEEGDTQWYDSKSEIPAVNKTESYVEYTDFSDSSVWSTNDATKWQLLTGNLIANTLVNATNGDYWRTTAPQFTVNGFYIEGGFEDLDQGDCLTFELSDASSNRLIGIQFETEYAYDSLRRPHLLLGTSTYIPVYSSVVKERTLYSFQVVMDHDTGTFNYYFREGGMNGTLLSSGTESIPAGSGSPTYIGFTRSSNTFPDDTGIGYMNRVRVTGYVPSGDMNPAHIIRECLVNPTWGMGYLSGDVDDTVFQSVADDLYSEAMGLSLLWDRQIPIEDFVKEVLRHINAVLYVDRTSGKFVLKLIRNDYSVGSLITLDESNITSVSDYNRIDAGDAVNSITVIYWDGEKGENASITADDPALIQQHGVVIGNTIQYPGVTNATLAYRAAARDLQSLSSPLLSCTIEANREASDLNIGDVFKFEWPQYHDSYVVMRVMQIAYGDGSKNRVRIIATEDVFSIPSIAYIVPEENAWEDIISDPVEADYVLALEAPYYELVQVLTQSVIDGLLTDTPELGYVIGAASRPDNALSAQLWIDDGSGFENKSTMDFAPYCELAEDLATAIAGSVVTEITYTNDSDIELVDVGSFAQINDEIVEIEAIDTSTNTLTIGRGLLDSVIANHSSGDAIVFWDLYSVADTTEYADSEELNIRILPTTGQGTLPISSATSYPVTMDSRAIRPYLPAQFKINSSYFPEHIDGQTAFSISWVHRDRTQQTSGTFYDFLDASIGPETNITYEIDLYDETGAFVKTVTGETGTSWSWSTEVEDSVILGGAVTLSYYDLIISLSPVCYFRLDESSGSTADNEVSGSDGGYTGSPVFQQTGLIDDDDSYSVYFDSGSSELINTNYTGFTGSNARSYNFWIKSDGTGDGNDVAVMAHGYSSTGQKVVLRREEGGSGTEGYLRIEVQGGYIIWSINIFDNTVHNVCIVLDGTTLGDFKCYVDSIEITDIDASASTSLTINTSASTGVTFCCDITISDRYLNAYIDEIALFDYALSDSEIENIYNNGQNSGGGASYRLNGQIRAVLKSKRDGYYSRANYDVTVKREGYGFQYGYFYGGGS